MIIQATNTTLQNIVLTDLSGYALLPATPIDLGSIFNVYQVAQSNVLIKNVATGAVIINNGTQDLDITDAVRYICLFMESGNGITELIGDVTASVEGVATTTIASGAVSLIKMANLPASTIIGNNLGTANTPLALNPAQVKSLLDITEIDVANLTTDLASKINSSDLGQPNGVATLDSTSMLAQNITWGNVVNTPTTLADYGITDSISTATGVLPLENANITSSVMTTTTNSSQVLDSLSSSLYRTVYYLVQVSSGTSFQATEIFIIQDGSTTYMTEFGSVVSNEILATFDSTISGGEIQLLVTPINASTIFKMVRTAVSI